MAKSYAEILRIETTKLAANAASPFDHPTAKGDAREALILDFLRVRLGSAFSVDKAEVIDSRGVSTGEFDAVIYDNRVCSALATDAGRKVVRVEAVAATIETKSDLTTRHLDELFEHQNKELMQLTRFFEPNEHLRVVLKSLRASAARPGANLVDKWASTEPTLKEGVGAMAHFESIPEVVSFAFGFHGCSLDSAAEHVENSGVDVVSVLGRFTVAKSPLGFSQNPPDVRLFAEGEDALGGFLFLMEDCLEKFLESRRWVAPAWRRYFWDPKSL